MGIISKYLLKEALFSFFAVLTVLLLILLGGVFVKLLGKVAEGSIEASLLFPLLFWGSLKSITTLLAVSLFLGLLLTLGRLYKDSEIYALRASGVGDGQLLRPFVLLGIFIAVILALLAFWLGPQAERNIDYLRAEAAAKLDLGGITPGRFMTLPGQEAVVFAESLDTKTRKLNNIFVFYESEDELRVISARSADQVDGEVEGERFLELEDGQMFTGLPGDDQFSHVSYKKNGVLLADIQSSNPSGDAEMLSLQKLWQSGEPAHKAELHWRLSSPVSALVLTLLALPMSYATPRQGRFGKLALAILIYIVYVNLLGLGKTWLENGEIPIWLGLWWVHFVFFAVAVYLLMRQNKALSRWFGGRSRA
jgi:lipopolysaccharide export system permease protein